MMNTNAIFAIVVLVAVVGAVAAFVVSEPVYGADVCKSQGPERSPTHSNGGEKEVFPFIPHNGCGTGIEPDPGDEEEEEEEE